jgi:hypothetical protein
MRGWLRLYLVISVVWVGWFGYDLYDAHKQRASALDFMQTCNNAYTLHQLCAHDVNDLSKWAGDELARERFAVKALPIVPAGLPIVFFVALWIRRGFKS